MSTLVPYDQDVCQQLTTGLIHVKSIVYRLRNQAEALHHKQTKDNVTSGLTGVYETLARVQQYLADLG